MKRGIFFLLLILAIASCKDEYDETEWVTVTETHLVVTESQRFNNGDGIMYYTVTSTNGTVETYKKKKQ